MTQSSTSPQESFFARVKAELQHLFTHVPGWEASAAATLTYLAPMVEAALALTDPTAVPLATLLIQKIQSAMAAAAVVVKDAGPKPTLVTYLNAINKDLQQLEAAAALKDPTAVAKLNAIVIAMTSEVNAILTEVGPATA